ncbi:NAD dependent epimerase/dehydratase family protein-like protein [Mycena rebaudengoi]|nr:NAD dependent epimerase/dehydratase family protein-like protein [Mycena rebaudengoi]
MAQAMATIKQQVVQSRGMYHGLPVHGDEHKGLTAIVTGANGISGQHMVRVLAQSPSRWSKIYCLSRRPPAGTQLPVNATHISVDFLSKPEVIAAVLRQHGITHADHVFFFSYIQVAPVPDRGLWSNAEQMCIKNMELLSNFLTALTQVAIVPRRVLLQTGAKQYGVHLGPAKVPAEETDPRVLLEPNFYYPQEDYLLRWCAAAGVGWNVVRPSYILGAVQDAAMNLIFPLAVYAAVAKKMGRKIEFPGDMEAWETLQDQSSATLNGYLEEWAVLTEDAKDQAFNATDGSHFTWSQFWPRLAKVFGVEWEGPVLDPKQYKVIKRLREETPRGYGLQTDIRRRFSIVEWAKRPDVQKAWEELAREHDLLNKELTDADRVFGFLQGALENAVRVNLSMDKARRFGFFGTVSSSDCMLEVIQDFVNLKMIPSVQVLDFAAKSAYGLL